MTLLGADLPSVIYTDYTANLSQATGCRPPHLPCPASDLDRLESELCSDCPHPQFRAEFVRQSILSDYKLPAEKVTTIGM
jgi:hypothetical protein